MQKKAIIIPIVVLAVAAALFFTIMSGWNAWEGGGAEQKTDEGNTDQRGRSGPQSSGEPLKKCPATRGRLACSRGLRVVLHECVSWTWPAEVRRSSPGRLPFAIAVGRAARSPRREQIDEFVDLSGRQRAKVGISSVCSRVVGHS